MEARVEQEIRAILITLRASVGSDLSEESQRQGIRRGMHLLAKLRVKAQQQNDREMLEAVARAEREVAELSHRAGAGRAVLD